MPARRCWAAAIRRASEAIAPSCTEDGIDRAQRPAEPAEIACGPTWRGYIRLPFWHSRGATAKRQRGGRRPLRPLISTHPTRRSDRRPRRGSMKIRPLQDRILVKRIDEEETTKGGIIIPDTAKEKPSEGKVIAVGKGKVSDDGKVHPLDVKKGDRVLFSKYAGTEVQVEGDEHIIIREDDVLGVVE